MATGAWAVGFVIPDLGGLTRHPSLLAKVHMGIIAGTSNRDIPSADGTTNRTHGTRKKRGNCEVRFKTELKNPWKSCRAVGHFPHLTYKATEGHRDELTCVCPSTL